MTNHALIQAAIEYLKSHRIAFEAGLTDNEIKRLEGVYGFHFPPDFRLFLETALPVSGGFPNWRSESEKELRYRYLDRPSRGVLFDVEHNSFWPEEWGLRPADMADALAKASEFLTKVPQLIPVRSHFYIPASPAVEGNPVFSVRQTDIVCAGRDLPSYLMSLFESEEQVPTNLVEAKAIPFWTEVARTSRVRVPNLAGPVDSSCQEEYERICRVIKDAGFWAEVITLWNEGTGVSFDRHKPTGDRRHGILWMARRDFGWLLCIRCPRLYFVPDAQRIPQLCLTLLDQLPYEELNACRLPFWNFKLDEVIHQEFGLVAIQNYTDSDDERERKLRAWERLGWRAMSCGQEDQAWDRYKVAFGYPVQSSFTTPFPSITWDIASIYLYKNSHFDQLECDLTLKALEALKKCTKQGEELLALDWNHPCFFFDPHLGITDARPTSWAVPVLPNGDHYIFLAEDLRFGIIGNCVDRTMCVFGQELLDSFSAIPPVMFSKPTWTFEQQCEKERLWAKQCWQRLTVDEKDELWERFDAKFAFYQRRTNTDSPATVEPTPSVTWAVESAPTLCEGGTADLTLKVLAGLQKVTKPGERLYALNFLHWYNHYRFDPHRLKSADLDSWALPVYTNDNYSIFLAPDFRFGFFGNPLEKTFCVFGQELLDAISNDRPLIFERVVRKDGKARKKKTCSS